MSNFNKNNYLKTLMDYHGFQECDNYLENNATYNSCLEMIKNMKTITLPYSKKIKIKEIIKETKNNSEFILDDVDQNIIYMNNKKYSKHFSIYNNDQIIKKYSKIKNIFDVSVKHGEKSSVIYNDCIEEDPFIPVTVNNIFLSRWSSDVDYFHELGHLLIGRNRGIVENYLHNEFVPIFMELLYSCNKDQNLLLEKTIATRIDNMKYSLDCNISRNDSLTEINRDKYLISGLFAFYAFNQYQNFNLKQKHNMLDSLKEVLNGESTVESFLTIYEIDFQTQFSNTDFLDETIEKTKQYKKCYNKETERGIVL